MPISNISVTAKTRSLANGTANDATVPEANFVELYNNDQTVAGSLNTVITAVNNLAPLGGMKNLVIGGDFSTNPWQRGTSFSAIASGAYSADRFLWNASGSGDVNITQSTDVPTVSQTGRLLTSSLKAQVSTADSALSNHIYCIETRIEGYNFLSIAQKAFTLSFWVKSALSGIHSVAFQDSVADQSYVAEYTIATANTWQYVTVNVPASPSGGTWNYTNGIGISILWALAASVNTGTAGSWQVANYGASVNQVNVMASTANFFQLAMIQLESGNAATAFENRNIQTETLLCQRYYYSTISGIVGYSTISNQNWSYTISFPAAMRTTPSVAYLFSAGSNYNGISTVQSSNTSLIIQQILGTGNAYCFQNVMCNAEL